MFENPFRYSKGKLFAYTFGLVIAAVVLGMIGCGNIYVIPVLLWAGCFGSILAYKMWRDLNAASQHVQHYTPIQQPLTEKTSDGTDLLEVPSPLSRDY